MSAAAAWRAQKKPDDMVSFLWTRGVWLIVLEATWISFSWSWDPARTYFGVMWALGGSMILLAVVTRLGPRAVFACGVALLIGLEVAQFQPESGPLRLLVQPGSFFVFGHKVGCSYPLLPWFGAAALGWGSALAILKAPPRNLASWGIGMLVAFGVYRFTTSVDPNPWEVQSAAAMTVADFLSPSKYPPSVAFYLLTLGAALVILSGAHLRTGPLSRVAERLGRVPMMFYLLHLPLAHLVGNAYAWLQYGQARVPSGEPVSLAVILGAWLLVLAMLVPVCFWWDSLKRRRRDLWWLRYL